jgi:L-seryl-tRNA(Ser) seleniumtransferase
MNRAKGRKPKSRQTDTRRDLPQVERLIQLCRERDADLPHFALAQSARQVLAETRKILSKSVASKVPGTAVADETVLAASVLERARDWAEIAHPRVLNATGVPLHTNLGRAPLAATARRALALAGEGYLALEYDLKRGRRSIRGAAVESQLRALTGAEAALVVNNNAAAVLLALSTLATGRRVLVSRGELIEIGGSYRLPEVFEKSGAILHEIGTTNRTHLRDYERPLAAARTKRGQSREPIALVLRAHPSNYRTLGFTARPDLDELIRLCHRYRLPLVEDLGSGALVDLSQWGYEDEPTVQEVLRAGADLVTFSGDKLLGGPQAGILLGKAKLIEACRKDALARAVRVDKQTLAALEATLALYFDPERAVGEIPVLRMLSVSYEELERRAKALAAKLGEIEDLSAKVQESEGEVGGGSLPLCRLPTWVVSLKPGNMTASAFEGRLRSGNPPVVARVQSGRVWYDLRTLMDVGDDEIVRVTQTALEDH